MQEIINIKPQVGMKYASYCYKQSEPNDDENECHIDRVVVKGENEKDKEC
jgi:hypothetical protein